MNKILLSAAAALSMTFAHVQASDACGVKLTVKSPKVKRTGKSSHPSTILVVGESDSKLAKKLRKAGHTVETANTVSSAKRDNYRVVLADGDQYDSAKQRYEGSIVVKRNASADSNHRRVEQRLAAARAPRKTTGRTLVANAQVKKPVATGGSEAEPRRTAAASGNEAGGETRVAARPDNTPSRPATPPPARTEPEDTDTDTDTDEPEPKNTRVAANTTKEPRVKPQPEPEPDVDEPEPRPAKAGKWNREFYFATNSNNLNARSKKRLKANAEWLKANPDATVTIEGHTDTVGGADFNMELGERRAESAKEFLIGLGIDGSRISVVSKGEDEPAYSPGTSGKNRRVVILKD